MGRPTEIFVDPPALEADLNCAICTSVFDEPVRLGCGHTYCKPCLDELLKQSTACPTCRHLISKEALEENKVVETKIRRMDTFCENKNDGCEWTGPLWKRERHCRGCEYAKRQCRGPGCKKRVHRDRLQAHESECKFVPRPCPRGCGAEGFASSYEAHTADCADRLSKQKKEMEPKLKAAEQLLKTLEENRTLYMARPRQRSSFQFIVQDYLKMKERAGEARQSSTIKPIGNGPCTWNIRVYSNGKNGDNMSKEHLAVYLKRADGAGFQTAFTLTLVSADPTKNVVMEAKMREPALQGESHGFSRFAALSTVADPAQGFLQGGALVFRVQIGPQRQLGLAEMEEIDIAHLEMIVSNADAEREELEVQVGLQKIAAGELQRRAEAAERALEAMARQLLEELEARAVAEALLAERLQEVAALAELVALRGQLREKEAETRPLVELKRKLKMALGEASPGQENRRPPE
eukprot:tig00020610_g12035.t1